GLPRLLLRRHAGRALRREHDRLLRLRRVRGGLPGRELRDHGQRDRLHRQREPVGGVAQGQAGVRKLAGSGHRQQAGEVARLPLPRAVRGAGSRPVEDRPGELAMAEATEPTTTADAGEKTSLITGSEAIAVACKLADVDVITAYPIRPYDTVMQYVAKMIANGEFDAEYIVAEGEHSQFEIVK